VTAISLITDFFGEPVMCASAPSVKNRTLPESAPLLRAGKLKLKLEAVISIEEYTTEARG